MRLFYLYFLILLPIISWGQNKRFAVPLSPRNANYKMQIKLDTAQKKVTATQQVTFVNPSSDTIWTMPFHLYYNAFKSNRSTFALEAGSFSFGRGENWAWIEVLQVLAPNGANLTDSLYYITPDDNNTYDQTVLEVRLQTPILPYQSYTIDMEWQSKIPLKSIRTGYNKDYYFMAQWYPKLGVYEPAGTRFATVGQWNCHQYHANTEYYGEFGVYEVALTVPSNYVVGASGFLDKMDSSSTHKTYHFLAEDVIDFAWSANPHFMIMTDRWKDVEIQLYLKPEHVCNANRFLDATKYTLDFFEEQIAPYPYPNLTIISPPCYGLFSGAMEYPTLFTAPTLCILPSNIRTTETLTIHELVHQYFMQMLATNEQEEPWLDEGFTAYYEAKIMDKYYPKGVFYWDYMQINVGSVAYRRGRYFNSEHLGTGSLSQYGWLFEHGGQRELFYGKGALTLQTLEGLVGATCMQKIMKTYFHTWKFKHPCRLDFEAIVADIVPEFHTPAYTQKVIEYLHQAIYESTVCDYAVHSISNTPVSSPQGYLNNTTTVVESTTSSPLIESQVILYKLRQLTVPQEVLITFDDGTTVLEKWDGKAPSMDFTYEGTRKMVSAHLDPYYKIMLDKNLINNSYTIAPETVGTTRYFTSFLTWIQGAMVTVSSLL